MQEDTTRYQMEKCWAKRFPTVMPKAVLLTPLDAPMYEWIDKSIENGDMDIEQVFETGYHVPFLPSLEQFLNIKTVRQEVKKSFQQNNIQPAQVYKDVWDGKLVKENPIFIRHNGAVLGILLSLQNIISLFIISHF